MTREIETIRELMDDVTVLEEKVEAREKDIQEVEQLLAVLCARTPRGFLHIFQTELDQVDPVDLEIMHFQDGVSLSYKKEQHP